MTDIAQIQGTVVDGFEPVQEVFVENFRKRDELGAACAVYHRGEKVVDLWGGFQDVAAAEPWDEETMILLFSTSKGMAATATALAHSRGLFELDDLIADHWPAFGQHGKSGITVRQLLGHQAGLAALDERLSPERIADREYLSELLARKRPDWHSGTRHGYHGITLGWYMSELLRHTDGRTLGQYFAEEIAEPLNLQFHIGLQDDESQPPIAELDDFHPLALLLNLNKMPLRFIAAFLNPRSITHRAVNCLDTRRPSDLNAPSFRAVEIPSANGIGTIRSIAKVYGDLASGGNDLGIDERTIEEMSSIPTAPSGGRKDVVIKVETAYSMGYSKPYGDFQFGSSTSSFGTPGTGGSFAFADPDAEIGFAYAPNRLSVYLKDDPRELALRDAVYRSID